MYRKIEIIDEDIKTVYGVLYLVDKYINSENNLKDKKENENIHKLVSDSYNMLIECFTELLIEVDLISLRPKILNKIKDISKELKNNKLNRNDICSLTKAGMSVAGCLINTIIVDITHNNVEYLEILWKRIEVHHELLKYDLQEIASKYKIFG